MNNVMDLNDCWEKLPQSFYKQADVVKIAKELIGKILVTRFNNKLTAGRIVETEAYNGIIDKASHAYGERRTARTEIMYANGGKAYVYLCYGIHHLFNVVTNNKNVPHAVLIRAIEPLVGIDEMLKRTRKKQLDNTLTKGPGNVSRALGITTNYNGVALTNNIIFIAKDDYVLNEKDIIATARIGVNYAEEDALLPYRFILTTSKYVSGKKIKT